MHMHLLHAHATVPCVWGLPGATVLGTAEGIGLAAVLPQPPR